MEISLATLRPNPVGALRGRTVAWGVSPRPGRCLTPKGTKPTGTSGGGFVYEDSVPGNGKALLGCTRSDGVARVLTTLGVPNEDDAHYLRQTVADGTHAGFLISFADVHYGGGYDFVTVFDLRTGREPPGLGAEQSSVVGHLNDLVMNASGDTAVHAFIETIPGYPPQPESILTSTGDSVRTLVSATANSTNTTLGDLSLADLTLSFTNNGIPQTATLP